jgi:hypothetical protein
MRAAANFVRVMLALWCVVGTAGCIGNSDNKNQCVTTSDCNSGNMCMNGVCLATAVTARDAGAKADTPKPVKAAEEPKPARSELEARMISACEHQGMTEVSSEKDVTRLLPGTWYRCTKDDRAPGSFLPTVVTFDEKGEGVITLDDKSTYHIKYRLVHSQDLEFSREDGVPYNRWNFLSTALSPPYLRVVVVAGLHVDVKYVKI